MAENSGGHGGLYFIVGALAVVVVIVVLVLSGGIPFGERGGKGVNVNIEAPKAPAIGSGSSAPAR